MFVFFSKPSKLCKIQKDGVDAFCSTCQILPNEEVLEKLLEIEFKFLITVLEDRDIYSLSILIESHKNEIRPIFIRNRFQKTEKHYILNFLKLPNVLFNPVEFDCFSTNQTLNEGDLVKIYKEWITQPQQTED